MLSSYPFNTLVNVPGRLVRQTYAVTAADLVIPTVPGASRLAFLSSTAVYLGFNRTAVVPANAVVEAAALMYLPAGAFRIVDLVSSGFVSISCIAEATAGVIVLQEVFTGE